MIATAAAIWSAVRRSNLGTAPVGVTDVNLRRGQTALSRGFGDQSDRVVAVNPLAECGELQDSVKVRLSARGFIASTSDRCAFVAVEDRIRRIHKVGVDGM